MCAFGAFGVFWYLWRFVDFSRFLCFLHFYILGGDFRFYFVVFCVASF